MRRAILSMIVLGVGTATWATLRSAAPNPNPLPPTVTQLYPKDASDGLLWPNDHAWLFSVRLENCKAKTKGASAVIRAVQENVGKHSPVFGAKKISKTESEAVFGTPHRTLRRDDDRELVDEVVVCVQLIDQSAVRKPAAGEPTRYKLRFGLRDFGLTLWEGSDKTWIDGHIGCTMPHTDAKWKDGELHLMNFFVQNGETLTTYDVVVLAPE